MGTIKTPAKQRSTSLPDGYTKLLSELKIRIRSAQMKTVIKVNREMITLYFEIGRKILDRQTQDGWGKSIVKRLAHDLHQEFPDIQGFSPRNLWDMRRFYEAYKDHEKLRQLVAELPWGHNLVLLNKVKNLSEREWYISMTVEHGWSRNVLLHQIEGGLYLRQGKAATNFSVTLPPIQSDLAENALKDPYIFDFLSLGKDAAERDLENELLVHIREFLLELGVGFAFVGSQYHIMVGETDFYIDLLFYHIKLRAFVVIDLKVGKFVPEYAGKMNFYLSAVDDLLRHSDDQPSIGIILCKTRDQIVAEYALRDINKPIGIAGYQLTRMLPKSWKSSLPTIEELEVELADSDDVSK